LLATFQEFTLNKQPVKYATKATLAVAEFLDSVQQRATAGEGTEALLDSIHNEAETTSKIVLPEALDSLLGKMGGDKKNEKKILDGIMLGMGNFEAAHGFAPTADVVEAAIQQAHSAFDLIGPNGRLLDAVSNSANSNHSDPMSLQPNRAVVAILSMLSEAIPFAGYLPVDIGSNQSKLAVLSHIAGSAYGDYASGAIMDGVNSGMVYASSSRFVKLDVTGVAPFTSKFTQTNLAADPGYCDTAGVAIPLLRGRTVIYINGKVAARDSFSGSGASSPISGSVRVNGIDYATSGSINITTGVLSISITGGTLVGLDVVAEGFVDYETSPGLIPLLQVKADTYDIFANPWRAMTDISMDTATQLRNELSLDGSSESIMAIRAQMSSERHYIALAKAARLGKNLTDTIDFQWTARSAQMNRAQIFQDVQARLTLVDQRMANATMDHGVTHYYVNSWLMGVFNSLPSSMFVSSGVTARPGIYRVGRLFNKYEIYYSPRVATQTDNLQTAKMIGIGRSSQVARNPILLGDAVAPTFLDLNMQSNLKRQAAVYARDFTEVNPHELSALGCCEITINNLTA
jgi:hypothetical protein